MTRPEDPFDDRAMQPAADPWATIDRPAPTVYLGASGRPAESSAATVRPDESTPTVRSGDSAPTVRSGDSAPTSRSDGPMPDARLGRPMPDARSGEAFSTARSGEPMSAARSGAEVRFGPGVPTAPAPVSAPAWPAAAGKPKRPLWRRLVSLLSSLLTLALVVVVGLYLWQRLRPLEVESATVAVPRPAGSRCDVTVDVVATVHTNGRGGVIRYQWIRSGATPSTVLTERLGTGQRTATLTLKWTFTGVGTTSSTATLNITEPSPLQAATPVTYSCRHK